MENDTRHADQTSHAGAADDADQPEHVGIAEDADRTTHVSPAEDPERAQSASPVGPVGAPVGVEQGGVGEPRDDRDRAARAADAVDVNTETDPLRLLERDDRSW